MLKTLKAGIIGLGVGEQHIAGYEAHPHCKVVALCDWDPQKLEMAQNKYPGLKITAVADDILTNPNIDVVTIATYDNYHHPQIMMALEHNKHVFVEKPLCLYDWEAREIRATLQKKHHLKLSSNLILRRSPRFCELKAMIEKGQLGSLFYVEGDYNYGRLNKLTEGWRGHIGYYSVVLGGGVHIIDLLLWLSTEKIIEVMAYGNNLSSREAGFPYPDMVVAILKFESGLIGKMTVNFACIHPHFHNLAIYGSQATFINRMGDADLFTSRAPQDSPQALRTSYPGIHKGDLIYSFIDSILKGGVAEVTMEDVFATLSVCLAIDKALQQGQPVVVEYI